MQQCKPLLYLAISMCGRTGTWQVLGAYRPQVIARQNLRRYWRPIHKTLDHTNKQGHIQIDFVLECNYTRIIQTPVFC